MGRTPIETLEARRLCAGGGVGGVFVAAGTVDPATAVPTPDGGAVYVRPAMGAAGPAVVKLTAGGGVDPGFGTAGAYPLPASTTGAVTVFALADGDVLAEQATADGVGSALTRLTPGGAADPTFGAGGTLSLDTYLDGVLPLADGGLAVLHPASPVDFAGAEGVTRYDATGAVLTAFGTGGTVVFPSTADVTLRAATADGGLIATDEQGHLYWYTAAGTPDPTFGVAGVVDLGAAVGAAQRAMETLESTVTDLTIAPDGSLLVNFTSEAAGDTAPDRYTPHGLVRLTADGHVDTTFGSAGVLTTPDVLYGVDPTRVLLPDGGFADVAVTEPPDRPFYDVGYTVTRYTPAGQPDSTFGPAGTGTATGTLPGVRVTGGGGALIDRAIISPDGQGLFVQPNGGVPAFAVELTAPATTPTPAATPTAVVPAVTADTLPAGALADGRVNGTVRVRLTGTATAAAAPRGPVTVSVSVVAADGRTLTPLATVRRPAPRRAGQASAVAIPVPIPTTLSVGPHAVVVSVTDAAGATADTAAPLLLVVDPADVLTASLTYPTPTTYRAGRPVTLRSGLKIGTFQAGFQTASAGSSALRLIPTAEDVDLTKAQLLAVARTVRRSHYVIPRIRSSLSVTQAVSRTRLPSDLAPGRYDLFLEFDVPNGPIITNTVTVTVV